MDENNNLPKFRGKFKFPLCKIWRSKKVYSTNNDEYDDNDWDKPGLINGNLPINIKRKNAIVDKY